MEREPPMTDGCGKYYRTAKTPSARKNKQKVTKMSHCAKFLQSRVRKLQKDPRYCVRPEVKYSHGASDMHALHNYVAIASAV